MSKITTLLCFGDLVWKNGLERNHSILKNLIELALFDRGVYVEPSRWLSELLPNFNESGSVFRKPMQVLDGKVTIKRVVHFVPYKEKISILKKLENISIQKSLFSGIKGSDYVLFLNRIALDLEDMLLDLIEKARFSFFDFSDDFREFCKTDSDRERFDRFIERIIPKMDFVIHVNDHVKEKYSRFNNKNIVVRNATNFSNFDRKFYNNIDVMQSIKSSYSRIVGCIGTCNFIRMDLDAISALVSNNNEMAFVFIGNVDNEVRLHLEKFTNIFYIKFVPYNILPDYLNYFDVCTAPMLINDHTAGNDLLKLHDYLAMGKPIVASAIGGAQDLEFVNIYDTPASFVEKVQLEMDNNGPGIVKARKQLAYENSWNFRLGPLRDTLTNLLCV